MTPASNRRAPGTGSLIQLKTTDRRNGYWVGTYRATDATGRRVPKSVGDWDRDAAEAKLDALVAGEGLPANLVELRAVKAEAWDEGAQWAARECGAMRVVDAPWLTEVDNPYKSPLGGTK